MILRLKNTGFTKKSAKKNNPCCYDIKTWIITKNKERKHVKYKKIYKKLQYLNQKLQNRKIDSLIVTFF